MPPAVRSAFTCRVAPGEALADDWEKIAHTGQDMATRFRRGGKLLVFASGGPATDAQHVAVEFVHPVIVGKRALPAVSLTNDAATLTEIARIEGIDAVFAAQLRLLARPEDIALALSVDGCCGSVRRGLAVARELGLLTIALVGGDGGDLARDPAVDHVLVARTGDPCIVKEVHVTIYHLLWELVHVFLEQPDAREPEAVR